MDDGLRRILALSEWKKSRHVIRATRTFNRNLIESKNCGAFPRSFSQLWHCVRVARTDYGKIDYFFPRAIGRISIEYQTFGKFSLHQSSFNKRSQQSFDRKAVWHILTLSESWEHESGWNVYVLFYPSHNQDVINNNNHLPIHHSLQSKKYYPRKPVHLRIFTWSHFSPHSLYRGSSRPFNFKSIRPEYEKHKGTLLPWM